MALNPFSPIAIFKGRIGRKGKRLLSSNAQASFYADNGRTGVTFQLKGRLGGPSGNGYRIALYRMNATPRWAIRLFDPAGNIIGTVAAVASLAGMIALLAADATLGPLITIRVAQDVNENFSDSADFADATPFTGGV